MYVIGLVGPFGSGCSTVARIICELGYTYLSLSDKLRELYSQMSSDGIPNRKDMQDFGNKVREEHGSDYLAKLITEEIDKDHSKKYVVDSIRNPIEADYLRNYYSQFFLFGVFADAETRWERKKDKDENQDRKEFDKDDARDSGIDEKKTGQQVTETFRSSDIIILNNDKILSGNDAETTLKYKVREAIAYIQKEKPFRPSTVESCMAMAYATSMRSSCLKRKVGAVIVDDMGNVFSSGYNEVPFTQKSCLRDYGECYRDQLKNGFKDNLTKILPDEDNKQQVYKLFKTSFKILDYCRALHAEENAIINVARIGASAVLTGATLYTTTYPCNLCANKIAQVGIKEIVYFEPYPMREAKKILQDKSVCQKPFEGVTYMGYFRLMEVVR